MARDIQLVHQGFAPRTNAEGRSKLPTPYVPMIDPCRVCPGRCCHMQVTVPVPDVVSMASILGLPVLTIVSAVPTTHARAFPIDDDPRIHVRATPFAGRVEFALQRQDSGRCRFLADVDGYLRCSIYSVRPGACRTYPMAWKTVDEMGMPLSLLCPVPYAVTPTAEAQLAADVEVMLDGWALHDTIVARWIAAAPASRSLDAFIAFAIEETRAARGVDVSRIPIGATSEAELRRVMAEAGAR